MNNPNNLVALTQHIDHLPVECDGASRLVHLALLRANIPHVCMGGIVTDVAGNCLVPVHFWVLAAGYMIDYRLRMWTDESAPHGVFCRAQQSAWLYQGFPTEFSLRGCLLLEAVYSENIYQYDQAR